eukprot:CAMPEP_0180659052 /NCGR_PEP_ID=MMETSP1037_2-20121125/57359_1 /TAXON_ID=632150 /ORGANISM="Azadinium spinosum, Strain 3D9" /LENGTH=33 /DNA_ID= /DNA_START= /DNA_END= /DNA_ORIENTATION=
MGLGEVQAPPAVHLLLPDDDHGRARGQVGNDGR